MNNTEKNQLNASIAKAIKGAEFPDLKAILCQYMRIAGGAAGIAKMLKREYNAAKPGSMLRAMILQMILQGAKALTHKESAKDTSLLTDDDLERETQELLAKAAASGKYGPEPTLND